MGLLLLFVILTTNPQSKPIYQCAVVEYNHYYDDQGKIILEQIIWWEEDPYYGMVVRDWAMKKDTESTFRVPYFVYSKKHMCFIKSKYALESWTQHDPEVLNRVLLPVRERLGFKTLHILGEENE